MDKNLDDNLLIIQATIDDSRQYHGWKMNKYYSKLDKLTAMIKNIMYQNQTSNSNSYP